MSPLRLLCPLPTGMSRCNLVGSGWSEQGSNPKACQSASFLLPWNQERVFQQRASSCLATQQGFASYLLCLPSSVPGSPASAPLVPGYQSPDSGLLVQDALTGWGSTIFSAKLLQVGLLQTCSSSLCNSNSCLPAPSMSQSITEMRNLCMCVLPMVQGWRSQDAVGYWVSLAPWKNTNLDYTTLAF